MGLLAGEYFDLDLPHKNKKLLVISETDGCTVDGLIASTGCHVGGRTLRILDFGKVAATFVDVQTEDAIRIVPRSTSRSLALEYVPDAKNKWDAMLRGYQHMPADILFRIMQVKLTDPVSQILSRPGIKAFCEACGEEIINGREVVRNDMILCQACTGDAYYQVSEITGSDSWAANSAGSLVGCRQTKPSHT